MEILPCTYDVETNFLECGEQVQVADIQMDDLIVEVEGSHEEQGEGQWTVNALPLSEGHYNEESYNEFELDDQKLACEFLGVDAIGSELPSISKEESSVSESKWLEQDEPMAVWVKWRGKWQSGIKCGRADWPLATLKAKPTHDRKKYLVIFFPRKRNYSWADVLLIRPISEFPEPIAYRSHKIGIKIVSDLTLARRFIMQKLAVSMLNIIDQLPSEALTETARNVMVWKEFAMEAYSCKCYSDLGSMLLKLQNMILPSCLSSDWLQNSLQSWVERCQNASSAEFVETLKEELVEAILWNEVSLLQNVPTQPELPPEWKTWKQEVMKWFSMSHPIASGGDNKQHINDNPAPSNQISRKRAKLEVRRAETHAPQVEPKVTNQSMTIFNGQNIPNSGPSRDGRWGPLIVESRNPQTKDVEDNPLNGMVVQRSSDRGNTYRQCTAFIESKGRQCVRWANDGDVYCCVHLASRYVGNSAKLESIPPSDSVMCEGTTVLGTKCKHRALYGSSFCKKHKPLDSRMIMSPPERATSSREIVVVREVGTPVQVIPNSFMNGSNTEMEHCIGSYPEEGSGPCLESPKRHFLYCDKHLPSWLKRARNGKSRIISKEVFLDLLRDSHSWEQKLQLHQACEIFYKLFKSILSLRNPVPKEIQFQWVLSEASKDARVGKILMKLVCSEKERLERLWSFNTSIDVGNYPSPIEPVLIPTDGDCNQDENVIKCKVCLETFSDDQALGVHWMDKHKKEAKGIFRGYVCAICLDSFTDKKILETHVQERHHVQFVDNCMLYQCIPCSGHFGNPDQLWSHVVSVHAANFRQQNVIEDSSQIIEFGNSAPAENICKFCGLKFDSRPDLDRHHQAAHMGPSPSNPHLAKRGIRFFAHRLKSGRLTRPRFKKALEAASYKIRKRGVESLKRRIQSSKSVITEEIKAQSLVPEADSLGRLGESQCTAVANIFFSEVQKTKPRPSNNEILAIARISCCKESLLSSLGEKYTDLPKRLHLKAEKLCSENNILVEWHQEGFICPKGCKSIMDPNLASPLMPLVERVTKPRSAIVPNPVIPEWTMDECHIIIDSSHFRQVPVQRTIILCDDISFGREPVPVACVVEENLLDSLKVATDRSNGQSTTYTMPWESFSYIMKSLFDQSLHGAAESLQLGCACAHSTCSPETCDHVYLFDNDYEDANDIYGMPMKGRFAYDKTRRLILEEGYLVYECNQKCRCSRTCQNRVLQNGIQVKLEVFKTGKKGWAVRAGEALSRGTFVCEYIGEVMNEQEANKRRTRYKREDCTYFLDVDAQSNDMSRLIEGQDPHAIDSMYYGNVSRYINHSCSPNLISHQVLVESMDSERAHIGFYASRDIAVGEELSFNYRYKMLPGEMHPCFCGASICKGRLY